MKVHNYLILVVILLGLSSSLLAQYGGGSGDGFARRVTIQLDLTGVPVGVRPLYAGGSGDGFDRQATSAALNGQAISVLYSGGSGDGFDHTGSTFSIEGQALAVLYGGGSGDGFDRFQTSLSLGGVSVAGLYSGGSGDGFDRGAAAGALNGQVLTGLYAGGSGDGFDRSSFAGGLMGEMFMLYGGGSGDGFDNSLASFVISGQDLASLFGGGSGDGFDTEIYYGVLPLPLTLVRFDAFPMKDYVLLKWETEDEVGTDFFTIEKTKDGQDFAYVGETLAAGHSEPGELLHYAMEDHNPYDGTSFYRLKTTDFDGAISLSHLVEVEFSSAEDWDFILFPNPNTGRQLGFRPQGLEAGDELRFEVLDVQGRSLLRQEFTTDGTDHRFDLREKLAAGSYLIRATDAQGKTRAKLLIVQ